MRPPDAGTSHGLGFVPSPRYPAAVPKPHFYAMARVLRDFPWLRLASFRTGVRPKTGSIGKFWEAAGAMLPKCEPRFTPPLVFRSCQRTTRARRALAGRRAYPSPPSCAIVFTSAHDHFAHRRKLPEIRAKKSSARPDSRNSFCALLIKTAQKELRATRSTLACGSAAKGYHFRPCPCRAHCAAAPHARRGRACQG
jgi:hypothetical protein